AHPRAELVPPSGVAAAGRPRARPRRGDARAAARPPRDGPDAIDRIPPALAGRRLRGTEGPRVSLRRGLSGQARARAPGALSAARRCVALSRQTRQDLITSIKCAQLVVQSSGGTPALVLPPHPQEA